MPTDDNPFQPPATATNPPVSYEIKPPGWFTRGKVVVPDALDVDDVHEALLDFGYEVYRTQLIGADLIVKKTAFTGLAIKVKAKEDATEVLFGPFAPSLMARLLVNGLIPLIILMMGPWPALVSQFMSWVEETQPFTAG